MAGGSSRVGGGSYGERVFKKSCGLLRIETLVVEKYEFICDEEGNFPIAWMCRKLGVARSSYYEWKRNRGVLNSYEIRRAELADEVCSIFASQRARAGARGITAELRRRGHHISVKLVARVMAENGLAACL